MKRRFAILPLVLVFYVCVVFYSCQKEEKDPEPEQPAVEDTTFTYKNTLSEYSLFKGSMADLTPADNVELYELSTPLFTDYSEKQRLLKLPANKKLTARGDSLPQFPDGTIIAKTFYYYNDLNDLSQGKRILETRLLIKHRGSWKFSSYQWNANQTDAVLLTDNVNPIEVTWKQKDGASRTIQYRIPTLSQCVSCHSLDERITPIGPRLRNMNRMVVRNGTSINQLKYLQDKSLLTNADILSISSLPAWDDSLTYTLEERGRAYLDVNCAHCHNTMGMAANSNLQLGYEIPLSTSGILDKNIEILDRTQATDSYRMPKIGTTIKHAEGVELIRKYIESL